MSRVSEWSQKTGLTPGTSAYKDVNVVSHFTSEMVSSVKWDNRLPNKLLSTLRLFIAPGT